MEVRHIQAFIAVAEELSLRRAGRRLGVSQASISRQVQQLEQELGLTLFLRRRDGIELTHQGTLLGCGQQVPEPACQFPEPARGGCGTQIQSVLEQGDLLAPRAGKHLADQVLLASEQVQQHPGAGAGGRREGPQRQPGQAVREDIAVAGVEQFGTPG